MIIVEPTRVDHSSARLVEKNYLQWRKKLLSRAWEGRTEVRRPPLLPRQATSAEKLLEEYHALVDLDRRVELMPAQRKRLQVVEEDLDDLDEVTPGAQWMESRMTESSNKLDALLQAVQDLAERRPLTVP